MKNLQKLRLNSISTAIGVFSILSISLVATSSWQQKTAVKQMSLSSGVGTCFQRVTQSFTALMISNFTSNYLTKPFMDTTSECFSYAATQVESLYANSFKDASRGILALNSDIHWFHEKALKLMRMSSESGLDLSNSNIVNKYTSLEIVKDSFQENVTARVEMSSSYSTWLSGFGILGFSITFILLAFSMFQRKRRRQLFARIEADSEKALESNTEFVSANIERALDNILAKVHMPKTYSLFNKYHSDLLERAYKSFESNDGINIDEVSIAVIPQDIPTSFFQDSMGSVLDQLSEKAFSHGVILNSDLEDNFYVKGSAEALEQVLYNVLNFATAKTLSQVESRRLDIKSSALGGTVYLKIKIANYCFNANELDYIGDTSADESSVDKSLVLIHETVKDLGATIELRNTIDSESGAGCEIKVLLERVEQEVESKKEVTSITKGSKKDILRSFSQNA
jgi:hypothetical protein